MNSPTLQIVDIKKYGQTKLINVKYKDGTVVVLEGYCGIEEGYDAA